MRFENYKLSIWIISFLFIGVLFVVFIFSGSSSFSNITGAATVQDLEFKIENYIHKNLGDGEVEVIGVLEKKNKIEAKVKFKGNNYLYVLDDGKESLRKA